MEYYIYKGEDELYHWGIKGMKWGVRRFQNPDGSLTPRGEKRRARLEGKLEKLKGGGKSKEEVEAETLEAKKERILQSRSAKEIYKNANLFTTQELTAAKARLQLEKDIANLEPAEINKGKERVDKMKANLDSVAGLVASSGKAWNAFAGVYNSLYGNKKGLTLPTINDKVTSELDKYEATVKKAELDKRLRTAESDLKDKTDYDKLEETVKTAELNKRLRTAESDLKPKTETELYKEATDKLEAENKRRAAERTSREHDRSDEREKAAVEKHKADLDKSKAEAKKTKEEARKAKAEAKQAEAEAKEAKARAKAAEESGKSFLEKLASGKSDSSSDSSNATSTGKDYVENSDSDIFKVAFDIWGVDDD